MRRPLGFIKQWILYSWTHFPYTDSKSMVILYTKCGGQPPSLSCSVGWWTWRAIIVNYIGDRFVHAPSQWETTLQWNVVSNCLGASTERSLVHASGPWYWHITHWGRLRYIMFAKLHRHISFCRCLLLNGWCQGNFFFLIKMYLLNTSQNIIIGWCCWIKFHRCWYMPICWAISVFPNGFHSTSANWQT